MLRTCIGGCMRGICFTLCLFVSVVGFL